MEKDNIDLTDESLMPRGGSGMNENVASLFCYLGVWVTGIVFFLLERKRPKVRFHAAQSIILFGGLYILSTVFINFKSVFSLVAVDVIYLAWFILWIFMMYKGYKKEAYKLPLIGSIAEKIVSPS